jgi:TRAP-type uncharacterized transport system substrate-binding protein
MGNGAFAAEGPHQNLRVIASVELPSWLGVAVRAETGIIDLTQIKSQQRPVRVIGGTGQAFESIWRYYGLSREVIESWGGQFLPVLPALPASGKSPALQGWLRISMTEVLVRSGNFDVIMDTIYAAYTPEVSHWWNAAFLHNLRFLPLPDELIRAAAEQIGGKRGFIPHRLMRGVEVDTPAVERPGMVIYGRDDMPEAFAYLLAKALDEGRHLFRQTHLPYSYDPGTVARDPGNPLHPGAALYYQEMGYLS